MASRFVQKLIKSAVCEAIFKSKKNYAKSA